MLPLSPLFTYPNGFCPAPATVHSTPLSCFLFKLYASTVTESRGTADAGQCTSVCDAHTGSTRRTAACTCSHTSARRGPRCTLVFEGSAKLWLSTEMPLSLCSFSPSGVTIWLLVAARGHSAKPEHEQKQSQDSDRPLDVEYQRSTYELQLHRLSPSPFLSLALFSAGDRIK
ncbi:hypothetical protein EYF80_039273 [Liparis tanakae]|uniref:Uncharacterized protein n=1 Tax=Liparis tanakae TaxID=230148 RepID=A0A4Z2GCU6_9TELE|nr:hypothetical protein EYF80_039273 [Liparis tanakae]